MVSPLESRPACRLFDPHRALSLFYGHDIYLWIVHDANHEREGVNTMEEKVLEAEKAEEQLDVVEEALAYDIMLKQMDKY
jgi:hypothetical protein